MTSIISIILVKVLALIFMRKLVKNSKKITSPAKRGQNLFTIIQLVKGSPNSRRECRRDRGTDMKIAQAPLKVEQNFNRFNKSKKSKINSFNKTLMKK